MWQWHRRHGELWSAVVQKRSIHPYESVDVFKTNIVLFEKSLILSCDGVLSVLYENIFSSCTSCFCHSLSPCLFDYRGYECLYLKYQTCIKTLLFWSFFASFCYSSYREKILQKKVLLMVKLLNIGIQVAPIVLSIFAFLVWLWFLGLIMILFYVSLFKRTYCII